MEQPEYERFRRETARMTTRLRLNRGGDRQANAALYRTALSRLRWHDPTIAYMDKRLAESKTRREAIRRFAAGRGVRGERMMMAVLPGPLVMPRNLVEAARWEGRLDWLVALPSIVAGLADRWSLTVGSPFQPGGRTAWVAPVRDAMGAELVLKVAWRHLEAVQEADGLAAWGGDGAVKLHDWLDSIDAEGTSALLMERCAPGTALSGRPEPEQDTVVAGLLRRLWRTPSPGHRFRSLQVMCDQWADQFEERMEQARRQGGSSIDPGLAREGLALFRSLPAGAERHVLLCTDLHAGNVLAAEREPWLVIDPKPHVGDPAFDPLQHMLNCDRRLQTDPGGLARRMAGLLDLDPGRLLLWLFARCVLEAPERPDLADVARRLAPA